MLENFFKESIAFLLLPEAGKCGVGDNLIVGCGLRMRWMRLRHHESTGDKTAVRNITNPAPPMSIFQGYMKFKVKGY